MANEVGRKFVSWSFTYAYFRPFYQTPIVALADEEVIESFLSLIVCTVV